ncbi:tryptophan-rich sensory protein [Roseitranquillus sediminis]|uniref:tryptophan-rich sensory protein n=1 Tax=Roseitranquillus sediminis TaxID=2809051 RepID=UPI001D0C8116|nr:tryptophan-rich sensory protein [Roseitranquillus sediminis]MBM9594917.1 tryptophan-rich sensory protein [Roseitranquillus sediminis]
MSRAALVLVGAVAFALSPLLFGGFGGFPPDRYPVPQVDPPVQPVGWAFSIWGIIYFWLIVHAAVGAITRAGAEDWQPTRWPLLVALGVGAIWIPVAQRSPVLATLLILVMLGGAVTALLKAPMRDELLAEAPLGLFAGWLTAATAVSLGLLAAGYGVLGATWAAVAALVLAAVAAAFVLSARPSVACALAVAWAFLGIVVQNAGTNTLVMILAAAGMLAVPAFALWRRRG